MAAHDHGCNSQGHDRVPYSREAVRFPGVTTSDRKGSLRTVVQHLPPTTILARSLTMRAICLILPLLTALGPAAEPARMVDATQLGPDAKPVTAVVAEKVRNLKVAMGQGPSGSDIWRGLKLLAADANSVQKLRFGLSPDKAWFDKESGGVGAYQGSQRKPDATMREFLSTFQRRRLNEAYLDVVMVEFDAGHIVQGSQPEVLQVPRNDPSPMGLAMNGGRMDVRFGAVDLVNMNHEVITAWQPVGGPGSNVLIPRDFPIELPCLGVTGINTSICLPGFGGGAIPLADRVLTTRNAMPACLSYSQGNDQLARIAGSRSTQPLHLVWTTVPLRPTGNQQRAAYNDLVRANYVAHRAWLFDMADLLSRGRDGRQQLEAKVPALHPDWRGTGDTVNEAGQRRLAEAWWILLTRLAG